VREAKDRSPAGLRERVERGSFHFDREDAARLGGIYGFGGFSERRVGGPAWAGNGPQSLRLEGGTGGGD
jgi:hypothetical protein